MSITQDLLRQLPKHIVIQGHENTRPYECDGLSVYRQKPLAVVLQFEMTRKTEWFIGLYLDRTMTLMLM